METRELLLVLASSVLLLAAAFLLLRWNVVLWDEFAAWILADFTRQMRSVGLDSSRLATYLRWWGISLVSALAICVALGIPVIGIAVVFFIYVAPRFALEFAIARRRTLLRDQMVGAATAMANSSRAGLALAQALESVGKETPPPLALELRRIVKEFERGRPLPDALRDAKERLQLDGFTLFTSSLLTCLNHGGRVSEALDRISKSLQESQRLERKLEADTATGRRVVIILIMFPVVFLVGFYLMDPASTGVLFSTIPGQFVVLMVLALAYLSAIWAKRILTIDL
jgi:tight adherence protein B